MLEFLIIIIILSCGVATLVVICPYIAYISTHFYSMVERKCENITIKMPEIKMSFFRSSCVYPQNQETTDVIISHNDVTVLEV